MSNNQIVLDADNATVKSVVNQIRSDMRGGSKYGAYVTEFNVTHDTVKDHALALARLVTPETAQTRTDEAGNKVRTRFGNAVQAAGNGLRAALGKKESNTETDYLARAVKAATTALDKGHERDDVFLALGEALGLNRDDMIHMLMNQSALIAA